MKAVISGATRGIGKAIAHKLAQEGYDLVLLARKEAPLKEFKKELERYDVSIAVLSIDLSSETTVEILNQNIELFKKTKVLVNNLGAYSTQGAKELTVSALKSQLEINLYSAIRLTQLLLNTKEGPLSTIVNIGSVMSIHAMPFAADYSISKHAFKAWNDSLRESLRKEQIKVSAIYPGAVNTSSWDGLEVNRDQMIQAEDIAEIVTSILKMSPNSLIEEIRISPRDFNP